MLSRFSSPAAGTRRPVGIAALVGLALLIATSPVTGTVPAAPAPGQWAAIGSAATPLIPPASADAAYVWGIETGPDGRLYAYGVFQDASGDPTADSLAVLDPVTGVWQGIGSNGEGDGAIGGQVMDIAWFHGILYVAGAFQGVGGVVGTDHLAAWNGTSWTRRAPAGAFNGPVYDLLVNGDTLYASGGFTDLDKAGNAAAPGDADYVALFDGRTWTGLPGADGQLTDGVISIALAPDGSVYAGGLFQNAAGGKADHVARWDPVAKSWGPLGGVFAVDGAINDVVSTVALLGGSLYIGGGFDSPPGGDSTAAYLARWNGSSWVGVGGKDGVPALDGEPMGLDMYGSNLIVTGMFSEAGGVAGTAGIAAWNGSRWLSLGGGVSTGGVITASRVGRTLYAAGRFSSVANAGTAVPSTVDVAAYGLPGGPTAPRSPIATTGSRRVTLAWTAPASANGSPVTDYVIQYRKAGTTTWKTFNDGVRTTRSAAVTGLSTGTTYELRVRALNGWAAGSWSVVVRKVAG